MMNNEPEKKILNEEAEMENTAAEAAISDDDLENVAGGGFFDIFKNKTEEPVTFSCPFCGGDVEQEPVSTDMPDAWGYCHSASCGGRIVYKLS